MKNLALHFYRKYDKRDDSTCLLTAYWFITFYPILDYYSLVYHEVPFRQLEPEFSLTTIYTAGANLSDDATLIRIKREYAWPYNSLM